MLQYINEMLQYKNNKRSREYEWRYKFRNYNPLNKFFGWGDKEREREKERKRRVHFECFLEPEKTTPLSFREVLFGQRRDLFFQFIHCTNPYYTNRRHLLLSLRGSCGLYIYTHIHTHTHTTTKTTRARSFTPLFCCPSNERATSGV